MPQELARAKVNLCLHVTGQRDDGLHLLDSVVVFPTVGDRLEVLPADTLTLAIDGPFAQGLSAGADNLVFRAARLLGDKGAALRLHKNLPVASGIGGGSADAAACIRLLSEMWGVPVPSIEELAELGADVPVCLNQLPVRMSGIGEVLTPLPKLPEFWMVLVNAGQGVDTGAVFAAMQRRDHTGITAIPDAFPTVERLFDFLSAQRNDMQEAALNICPVISEVLNALSTTQNCALVRMSGSGGTCFGLYASQNSANLAAQKIQADHHDWWVVAARN